jgi:hypothetical protein
MRHDGSKKGDGKFVDRDRRETGATHFVVGSGPRRVVAW